MLDFTGYGYDDCECEELETDPRTADDQGFSADRDLSFIPDGIDEDDELPGDGVFRR